jgi:hypothetical protein
LGDLFLGRDSQIPQKKAAQVIPGDVLSLCQ